MNRHFIFISLILLIAQGCAKKETVSNTFTTTIENPLDAAREAVMVVISPEDLKQIKDFNPKNFVVMDGEGEIPSQYNFNDGSTQGIVVVLDSMRASEKKQLTIRFEPTGEVTHNYKKRTQAELSHKEGGSWANREYQGGQFRNVSQLRVPPEHKDHSWFIRYEGPGWESDKVGYRFYLDQRNATDVFGKLTPDPVLQQVGLDGFDSYHEIQPWGMDVMKVGKSLGIGSIGHFSNGSAIRVEKTDSVKCEIPENGNLFSSIQTSYYGWQANGTKPNLESNLSIHAGTRLSHQQLTLSEALDNLCTGIGKDPNGIMMRSQGDSEQFGYLATYGKQSLNNDELGLVVFFNPDHFGEFTSDEFSHIVTLKPADKKVDYYFAATWVKEPNGIKDRTAFESYVQQTAKFLANPVKVKVDIK
jgi:hypothetical protein